MCALCHTLTRKGASAEERPERAKNAAARKTRRGLQPDRQPARRLGTKRAPEQRRAHLHWDGQPACASRKLEQARGSVPTETQYSKLNKCPTRITLYGDGTETGPK